MLHTLYRLAPVLAVLVLAACGGRDDGAPRTSGESTADTVGDTVNAADLPDIDPARYYGLYGVEDELRGQFFVITPSAPDTPAGFIEIGAVWGDVAPWLFRPESRTRFVQHHVPDYSPEAIEVEFELDARGNAVALTFLTVFDEFGRRPRLGDVPDDWR